MRAKRILTLVLAFVLTFTAAWSDPALFMDVQAEEQERRVENLRSEENTYTWIFPTEEQTLYLDIGGLNKITSVEWNLYFWVDGEKVSIDDLEGVNAGDVYSTNEDDYSITIFGDGLSQLRDYMRDINWIDFCVKVNYGSGKVFEQWGEIGSFEEEYFVEYLSGPTEAEMLPNEDKYLGSWLGISIWNPEYPHGDYIECPINDMELLGQYYWGENGTTIPTENEFFYLSGDAESGWNLHSEDHGVASLRAYYTDYEGKAETYDFDIYSVGEIYNFEVFFENDINHVLLNDETTIETKLTKRYQDEHGNNQYGVEVEDYFVEISSGYDEDVVKAQISKDGKEIKLETKDIEANMGFSVNAFTMESEEPSHRAGIWFDMNICNEYFNIQPTRLENTELGKTLDLSGLKVYQYNAEFPNGKIFDNDELQLYVEWFNEDTWKSIQTDSANGLPNFERISRDGGNICVVAEAGSEEDRYEISRREFWFDGLDYHVWLEGLQNGDHGWIYVDEEITFPLNTENLADKENYEVKFELGLHQDETDEFVPFKNQKGLFKTVTKNGKVTGITVKGSDIKAIQDSLKHGSWFWICAIVTVDGEEVSRDWRGVELREGYVDYHYDDWGFSMLPYWDHGINKNIHYYLQNEEYPYGFEGEVQATDIQLEIVDGNSRTLTLNEWEDGTGWNLHAERYGHGIVTLTHPDVLDPEKEVQHSFDVWVGQDVWNAEISLSTGTQDIHPGGEMDAFVDVQHECYNEEEGHFKGSIENVAYVWEYNENQNEELIDFEADGNVLHITARDDAENNGETWIHVRGYLTDDKGKILKDEEGNDIELFYRDFPIYIREEFSTILPVSLETVEIGESVEVTPTLMHTSKNGTVEVTENIVFNWNWNPDVVEIRDSKGKKLNMAENDRSAYGTGTYTIKRLKSWGTAVHLYAYVEQDGEYNEVFDRALHMSEISYEVWFEKDRAGRDWYTWVFSDEDSYEVRVNTDNLKDENGDWKDGVTLEWNVVSENGEEAVPLKNGEEYTLSEDNTVLTLNGKLLAERGFYDRNRAYLTVKVNGIVVNEEPYSLNFWVQDNYLELEDDRSEDTVLSPYAGWYYGPEGVWAFVRNVDHPEGENVLCEVRDIQVRGLDGEDAPFEVEKAEDGTWMVNPCRYGVGEIEYTLYEESLGEFVVTRRKTVSEEIYRLDVYTDTRTEVMFPNTEMNFIVDVYQYMADEDGRVYGIVIPEERYEVAFEYYDESLIGIDENGSVVAYDEFGETGVHVSAEIKMTNGRDIYYSFADPMICVSDYDFGIFGKDLTVEYDAVISIEDLGIQMVEKTWENPNSVKYDVEEIILNEYDWLNLSEDGQSFTINMDKIEEDLPVEKGLVFCGKYGDHYYYNWMILTIVEEIPKVHDVFRDVPEKAWYNANVQYVYDRGLMTGNDGLFNPTKNVTRAQLVTTLYRLAGYPKVTDYSACDIFSDVKLDKYYTDAVCWAYNEGVTTGNPETGLFSTTGTLTRQQMAAFFFRFADYMGFNTEERADISGMLNADRVSGYATTAVEWAVGSGLISGSLVGTSANGAEIRDLNPQGPTTRAQLAAILQRFCEKNDL